MTPGVGGVIIDENGTRRVVQRLSQDVSSSGDTSLVAARGSGVRIRVLSVLAIGADAVNVYFRSGAGGSAISSLKAIGGVGQGWTVSSDHGLFQTEANGALVVNLDDAIAVGFDILWIEAA